MRIRRQKNDEITERKKLIPKNSIYILPASFTIANMLCGYYAIILCFKGSFKMASLAIFASVILDNLDGRIARMTNSSSEFGIQLDSLADLVSFGVAPAVLVYMWAFQPLQFLGRIGWLTSFIFMIAGAMRLARFNVASSTKSDKRYFIGLAIPSGAWAIAAMVCYHPAPITDVRVAGFMMAVVYGLSFLMVSRIKFRSFKDLDLKNPKPYSSVLPLALILVAVVYNPSIVFLVLVIIYIASGLLTRLVIRFEKLHGLREKFEL